jgi:hypothetical protein
MTTVQGDGNHRVCWASKVTTTTGHGQWIGPVSAQAWCDKGNREYPDIHHWVEWRGEPGVPLE